MSTSSDEEIEREENVQVVLSGVDTLKLDDHISQTDNHEKYIEVRSLLLLSCFLEFGNLLAHDSMGRCWTSSDVSIT